MAAKLLIRLVRSPIGHPHKHKITLTTLGLRRLGSAVVHNDTPQIRGMVRKVRHLVHFQALPDQAADEKEVEK